MTKFFPGFIAILITVAGAVHAQPVAEQASFTVADRKKIKALIGDFRRSADKPEARDAAVEKLLAYGVHGIKAFEPVIKKELQSKMNVYSTLFQKVAGVANQSRMQQLDLVEVTRLRETVLSLKKDDGLTKQRIIQEGDPALAALREMLVIPTSAVLNDPKVQLQRQSLLRLGSYWERLQRVRREQIVNDAAAPVSEKLTFEENLAGEEDLIVQLAMPMKPQNRAVIVANKRAASHILPEEAKCIMACNLMRNLLGLNVLQIDVKMCLAARDHSTDMATIGFFAHESPVAGKRHPADRAENFGTSAGAENIYKGGSTGVQANKGWFHSPGHHKNMLSDHRRIGVGYHKNHFTEMFGK